MKRLVLLALILLSSCAAQQAVTLLPRGSGTQGTGTLDRLSNQLTVTLEGKQYVGTTIFQTAYTSRTLLGPGTTTNTGQASALLLTEGGQIRCDFGFNPPMTMATGVCVDSRNVTYDLLINQ